MVAMLPLALDKVFTLLAPVKPIWLLPTVFATMTVAISSLAERRARLVAVPGGGAIDAPSAIPKSAVPPAAPRPAARHLSVVDTRPDLRGVLLSALSDARCQAGAGGVNVEFVVPEGLLPRVQPARLRPVVVALLRNAINHAPQGWVFVGAMRADGEVRIIIIDDGPHIAEPLTGDTRSALARLLATSDASLFVDHRPGDGTTVMLSLPDVV